MKHKIIALVSDFGLDDPYVGIIKAVILQICPEVRLVDLTHQIPAGDIQRGAYVLWQAAQDFPPGTIFLCVIDPGVGTDRKAIMLESEGMIFIGPDNGLFSYVTFQNDFTTRELSNPDYQLKAKSNTFDGRDIFAPAAGYAALGEKGSRFGPELKAVVKLKTPLLSLEQNIISGEIISSDRFGNLITSLGFLSNQDQYLDLQSWIDGQHIRLEPLQKIAISINDLTLPLITTFSSLERGECGGLIGSTGLLEIVSNQESAEEILGAEIGTPVIVRSYTQ